MTRLRLLRVLRRYLLRHRPQALYLRLPPLRERALPCTVAIEFD